jgi:2,3-bisphosphoglycerate-dependent phosphoglycerate mutase
VSQGELAGGITPLILIRHGETTWNRAGRVQGQTDSPLSDLGRAQAVATGKLLSGEPIDTILSSDLGRTRDTAAAIAKATGAAVQFDPRLRERCYGEIEGHTWTEVEHKFPEAWQRMNARDPDYAPRHGESPKAFSARVVSALTEIATKNEGRRIVVVTHGGVVGMLYRYVMRIALDERREYALHNASINRFRFVESRWFLDVWGDVSHLEGVGTGGAGGEG